MLFGAEDAAVPLAAQQARIAQHERGPSMPKPFDPAAIWQGLSGGLTATYCVGEDLSGNWVTRAGSKVDLDWGKGSPDPAVKLGHFSARWTVQIQATHTEAYIVPHTRLYPSR